MNEMEKVVKDKKMEGFLVISKKPDGYMYLEMWVKSDKSEEICCDSPDCLKKSSWYTIPRGDFVFCEKCFNEWKEATLAFWIPFEDISVAGFKPEDYIIK